MLEIKDITVAFKEHVVLDHMTLSFQKGEIIGLVAPNGTGKSTLIHVIMNYLVPDTGHVSYNEKLDYSSKKKEVAMHQHISSFPEQEDLYPDLSGLDHMMIFANMWGTDTSMVDELIEKLEMTHYIKKKTNSYSLGMKQRLCFAMQLCTDTDVMLMDEVMNGLDPNNTQLISNILLELKEQGKIILVASHLLDNLEMYADRILFMHHGKIIHEQNKQTDVTNKEPLFLRTILTPGQKETILSSLPPSVVLTPLEKGKICFKLPSENKDGLKKLLQLLIAEHVTNFDYGKMTLNELYAYYYM